MAEIIKIKNKYADISSENNISQLETFVNDTFNKVRDELDRLSSFPKRWVIGELYIGTDKAFSASDLEGYDNSDRIIFTSQDQIEQATFFRLYGSPNMVKGPVACFEQFLQALFKIAKVHCKKDYDQLFSFIHNNQGNPGVCYLDQAQLKGGKDTEKDYNGTMVKMLKYLGKGSIYLDIHLKSGE